MGKRTQFEISDVESLKSALRDYNKLHAQATEHSVAGRPTTKRIGVLKKALLKHMVSENLNKIQLPNKDLLVLNESAKRPALNDNFLRARLYSYFEHDEQAADTLFSFLQVVPESEMQTRMTLKHIEADAYIENEIDND